MLSLISLKSRLLTVRKMAVVKAERMRRLLKV